jgi:hypothetical protein
MGIIKTLKKDIKRAKKIAKIARGTAKVIRTVDKYTGGNLPIIHTATNFMDGAQKAAGNTIGGKIIGKIVGSGDYTVLDNSLTKTGHRVLDSYDVPTFSNGSRSVRVRHREYIGDVYSHATSNTFDNNSYSVNPGDPITFPWLSGIASQYDQWQPNGIVFAFKSTSSAFNGTTQALGTVIIASDYDTLDNTFASKQEMENSEFSISCATSQSMLHPIECNESERPTKLLYVRKGQATPSDSLKFYDLCNTQVATAGVAAGGTAVNLGELWVSYDITFFKEQMGNGAYGAGILEYAFTNGTGVDATHPWGTAANRVVKTGNNLLMTFNSTTTATFPPKLSTGNYLLIYYVLGSSTASVAAPTLTYTNCEAGVTLFGSNTTLTPATSTNTVALRIQTIRILNIGASFVLSGGVYPDSVTAMYFSLTQINPSISA